MVDGRTCWGGLAVTLHDASAAVVAADGSVRASLEERFSGRKRDGGWPHHAVRWALENGCEPGRWGIAWRPWSGLLRRLLHGGARLTAPRASMLAEQLLAARRLGRVPVYVPHHRCHAAMAFWTSVWDSAAVMIVDGAGEGWTSWLGIGEGWRLRMLARTPYPHSVGMLYAGVTEHLGFRPDREEGTVMALAALARGVEPRVGAAVRQMAWIEGLDVRLDLDLFAHHRRQRPILRRTRVTRRFGPPRSAGSPLEWRHVELAGALQDHTERLLVEMAARLRTVSGRRVLCLGGGVALNAAAVRAVRERAGFDAVHVPPAAHDGGTSIGAALLLAARSGGVNRERLRSSVDRCGPSWTVDAVRRELERAGYCPREAADPDLEVAAALASGAVVGRFRGPAEIGPRALGQRSLLADPRRSELRSRLNSIKGREWFRPVAPVMTRRAAERFLKSGCNIVRMESTAEVRPRALRQIPVVVHSNGTTRPQVVEPGDELEHLLQSFGLITGIEVLANTSFNGPGMPIVHHPVEALRLARRRGVDVVDVEGCLVDLSTEAVVRPYHQRG